MNETSVTINGETIKANATSEWDVRNGKCTDCRAPASVYIRRPVTASVALYSVGMSRAAQMRADLIARCGECAAELVACGHVTLEAVQS